MERNRRIVFGEISTDRKTVLIYIGANEMYDFTISRRINNPQGGMSTVMARFKHSDDLEFEINDAYIVHPTGVTNICINIPPNFEKRSNSLDIVLEAATFSNVKMAFNDNQGQYVNLNFSSSELNYIMPGNCGHEEHLFRAINNHAKVSLALVGKSIVQQFIHNYMEKAMMEGNWNDPENILPGLFTYIGIQTYQPNP